MNKLKKWLSPAPLGYIQMFLFILIELLLIFGKQFSKFHLFGQLHLYDALLILLAGGAGIVFLFRKDKVWNIPVLSVLAVSLIYLFYSYFAELGPSNYMVRQYALFLYLGCTMVIFYSFVDNQTNRYNIRFIALMGISAFVLQIGYHIYNFIFTPEFASVFFTGFNYISKMAFLALFVFVAYVLVYIKKWWRWPLLLFLFFLSLTLGNHSSAIISILIIFGTYLFIHFKLKFKIILIVTAVLGLIGLFNFLPEYFQDKNSLWRLMYWTATLKDAIINYYGMLGHGFGVKYTTPELLDAMGSKLDSHWMVQRPEEQYVTPMHNSFITIAFHIGFIFLFILFIPLKNAIWYIFNRTKNEAKPEKDFLVLSLIGVICYTNFNVVLELPHVSAFFWLIYFTTVYQFAKQPGSVTLSKL